MPPRPRKAAGLIVLGSDATVRAKLRAVAALHQPVERRTPGSYSGGIVLQEPETYLVCGECKTVHRAYDGPVPARWPCATARLLGPWPFTDGGRS